MGEDVHLEELRRGGRLESSGRFTLNSAAARRKLGHFALGRAGYLLKAVQAAVAMGSSDVRVGVGARNVTVRCAGGQLPEPEAVRQAIFDPLEQPDSALRHLALALNAALALDPQEVTWTDAARKTRLRITPEGVEMESCRGGGWPFRFSVKKRWSKMFQSMLAWSYDHVAILKRCRLVPCRLDFSGLHAEKNYSWRQEVTGEELPGPVPLLLLEAHYLDAAPSFHHPAPWSGYDRIGEGAWLWCGKYPLTMTLTLMTRYPSPTLLYLFPAGEPAPGAGPLRCRRSFLFYEQLDRSEIIPIKDGVCLDPIKIDLGRRGVRCYVDADGLRVTASQFGIVRNKAFKQMVVELRKQVHELRRQAREHGSQVRSLLKTMVPATPVLANSQQEALARAVVARLRSVGDGFL